MSRSWQPHELIDLDAYPLLDQDSPARHAAVERAQSQLDAIGAAELPGFLSPAGIAAVVADALESEQRAHRSGGPATAYLEFPDFSLPEDHPRRWLGLGAVDAVAWDLFDADSPIRWLYESDLLAEFIGEILDRGPIYRYADPLGGLNLASMRSGDELQWHFDQTDFVVSLAIRDAEEGGDFEVAPRIRSVDDEHYDKVGDVLFRGDRSGVLTLPMRPGTLLVFEGRHSLHRVSPIVGDTTRLVALFGYDSKPGTMSSDLLKMIRYGRTEIGQEPVHYLTPA
jgi:hypothetical protein